VDCGFDLKQKHGVLCNCSEDFLVQDLFSKGELRGLGSWPMDHGAQPVHHGPWVEEVVVAHQSACSRSVSATSAHRDMGKTERGVGLCRGDAHRSLDGGETATEPWFQAMIAWVRQRVGGGELGAWRTSSRVGVAFYRA
jgi:hypothetical protein